MRTRTSKKKGGGFLGLGRRRSSTKPANMGNGTRKRISSHFPLPKFSKKKSNTNKNSADYKKIKTDIEEYRKNLENGKQSRRVDYEKYGVVGPSSRIERKEAENDKTLSNIFNSTNKGIKDINKNTRSQKRKGMFGRMKKKIGTQLARGTRKLASNPLKELLSRYYNKNNKGNEWGKLLGIIYDDVDTSNPANVETNEKKQLIKYVPEINGDGTVTLSALYDKINITKPKTDKEFEVVQNMDKRKEFLDNIYELMREWDHYLQNKKITTEYEKKTEYHLKIVKALAKKLLKDINKVQDAYRNTREERRVRNIENAAKTRREKFLNGKTKELQSWVKQGENKYYQEDIEYMKEKFDDKLNNIAKLEYEYNDYNQITIALSTMENIINWMNAHKNNTDGTTKRVVGKVHETVKNKLEELISFKPIENKINDPKDDYVKKTVDNIVDALEDIKESLEKKSLEAPVVPGGNAPANASANGHGSGNGSADEIANNHFANALGNVPINGHGSGNGSAGVNALGNVPVNGHGSAGVNALGNVPINGHGSGNGSAGVNAKTNKDEHILGLNPNISSHKHAITKFLNKEEEVKYDILNRTLDIKAIESEYGIDSSPARAIVEHLYGET